MPMSRKFVWDLGTETPNSRDVLSTLESINRRLGYLLVTLWVSLVAGAAFWVIQKTLVIAGW